MNIGIIVYSQTGNTLSVARRLEEKLLARGHIVRLETIAPAGEKPTVAGKVTLKHVPDASGYDAVIFGCPVQAFSPASVMRAYLAGMPSLKGKKAGCFVTQSGPSWMGGNRSIRHMKAACEQKGARVTQTGIVKWSDEGREKMIGDVVERLSGI